MRYLSFIGYAHAGQTSPAWIFAMKSLIHGDDMTTNADTPSDPQDSRRRPSILKRPWKPTDEHPDPWKPTVIGLVILFIAFVIYRLLRRPRQ